MAGLNPAGLTLSPSALEALDWVPTIIWIADLSGRCCYVNRAFQEFTGSALADALGDGWLHSMHPDDAAAWPQHYQNAAAALQEFALDCRIRRRDGRYRWHMKRGKPFYDGAGALHGYAGSCWDVSSQKQALESLRQAGEKQRAVLGSLKQAVTVIEDFVRIEEPKAKHAWSDRLTPRQRQILQFIARGHSTKDMAVQLHVSVKTVESHRAQLMQRLNIHDVAGLTRYAIRAGLVQSDG